MVTRLTIAKDHFLAACFIVRVAVLECDISELSPNVTETNPIECVCMHCMYESVFLFEWRENETEGKCVWKMDHWAYLSQINPVQVFCFLKLDSSSIARSVEHFSEKSIPISR